jgi:hypothetical protein
VVSAVALVALIKAMSRAMKKIYGASKQSSIMVRRWATSEDTRACVGCDVAQWFGFFCPKKDSNSYVQSLHRNSGMGIM